MLAVVSDLHLTDGTTGPFNVNPDAWDIFFEAVTRKRKRSGRDHGLTVVLAGDILDLLRSTVWLEGQARPWSSVGLEEAALRILRGVLEANADSLGRLRDYVRRNGASVVYVLGNHDRLVGRIRALKDEITSALGPVDFREGEYRDALHRAVVVHGHRWDPYNWEGGGRAPIGDAIVVELFNRYPLEVKAAFPGDGELHEVVGEMDNVRPLGNVPAWILWSTRVRSAATVRKLKAVWNGLVGRFLEIDFVGEWMKKHNSRLRLFDEADKLNMVLKGSRLVGFGAMDWMGRKLGRAAGEPAPGAGALGRDDLYLVAGHTHVALTEALDAERVHFNAGTWRKVWVRTANGAFAGWKEMGCVMVYGPGARHRFAAWRGELL